VPRHRVTTVTVPAPLFAVLVANLVAAAALVAWLLPAPWGSGVLLAVAANAALAVFVFKVPPWPDFGLLGIAFAAATGVAVAGGLLLSRGVCHHPPLEILRGAA